MVLTLSATQAGNGPRPVNMNKDVPQLMELLRTVFGEKMEADEKQVFTNTQSGPQGSLLWRLNPVAARLTPGFVWESNGRVVGNVTLLTTQSPQRYLVANVAVFPEMRRQGIARQLMEIVAQEVQRRGGREILLQVVKGNEAANNLYRTLNYTTLGSMTLWQGSRSRSRELLPARHTDPPPAIRPIEGRQWREAYRLDSLCVDPDLNWPEPLAEDYYRRGFWRQLGNFLNARQMETWAIKDNDGRLAGLANINSEWGRAHRLRMRVDEPWQGQLERPLLAKLLRRLSYLARRPIRIEHPDNDVVMNQLLTEANFRNKRTLTHMRLDLA